MKKRTVMFIILALIALFTLSLSFVISQASSNNVSNSTDKAYKCLENKVKDKCDTLTFEQQVFSLLALRYDSGIKTDCKDAILDNAEKVSDKPKCWPKDRCSIKSTAQAVLALSKIKENTDEAETWLLSKNTTPANLDWYIQIESNEETTCTIDYGPIYENGITIGADKKIRGDAGSCLPIDTAGGSYWLRISSSSNCYDLTYKIKCDKGFITTLLYKKSGSSTVYVSEKVNSASGGGETSEKISSVCFGEGGVCDYEGSLWASVVLSSLDHDVSSHMPYLTSNAPDNEKLLPYAFLYMLKDYPDFYTNLINQQKQSLWDVSGDKFYDTALALLSLQNLDIPQVASSKDKLLTLQDNEGCWQGNIRNTAFILYAVWLKKSTGDGVDTPCRDGPGFCRTRDSCINDGGEILSNYECSGIAKCCSKDEALKTCEEKGGIICNSNQYCTGNELSRVSDIQLGQSCCLNGECKLKTDEKPECERFNDGICKSSCDDKEEVSESSCNDVSLKCCVEKSLECESNTDCKEGEVCKDGECVEKTGGLNWFVIWILIILIILVVLGIIFRDRLRNLWFRVKTRGKGSSSQEGPRRPMPPGFGSAAPPNLRPRLPPGRFPVAGSPLRPMRPMPSPILPQRPSSLRPIQPKTPATPQKPIPKKSSAPPKKEKEYDDVMEKLKKISK